MTPEELTAILQRQHQVADDLLDPPPYRFRHTRQVNSNEIFVINRETAQAQVRLEFPDGDYDESLVVPSSLYNNYFGNSMSSVVFQELREARALAYSAAAQYTQGGRLGAENMALGAIGSQNDKAIEATAAFIELFDNMPASADRYRSGTVGFRAIPGTVRGWQLLGLEGDPRPQRFAQLQNASLEDLMQFQREHIAGKPKLISIVGDTSRMDMSALSAMGTIRELSVDDVFVE
jgi:predicted Zn-dependent peptidase